MADGPLSGLQLAALALIPSARRDPRVRPHLLASKQALVLYGRSLDATQQDAPALFRRLVACDLIRAVRALERSPTLAGLVRVTDCTDILESDDPEVRLSMLGLFSRLSSSQRLYAPCAR